MLLMRKLISEDTFKYVFIIMGGLIIDVAVFLYLIKVGMGYYFSYGLGFCFGAVVNVFLLRRYFHKARFSLLKDVLLTLFINVVTFFIGIAFFWVLISWVIDVPIVAKLVSVVFTFVLNYLFRVHWVLKKEEV
jgi:putative flippase GtrA